MAAGRRHVRCGDVPPDPQQSAGVGVRRKQPLTLQGVEQPPVRDREAEPAWRPVVAGGVLPGRVDIAAFGVVTSGVEARPGHVRVVTSVVGIRRIQR